MPKQPSSSRQRFQAYLEKIALRRAALRRHSDEASEPELVEDEELQRRRRHRTFWELFRAFWPMTAGQRLPIFFALATLTLATLLKLVPPATTKLAVDYVLPQKPLPPELAAWLPVPLSGFGLLLVLAGVVMAVSLVTTLLHLAGRWTATVASKRVQTTTRRRAFEHAVQLPLHKVYDLKSGGVPSLLRDDAGGVAELIFSMLYNPWRAVVQLIGSLAVLAWVDWRLLLGAVALLPAVYLTHRTWIDRIRPLFRDIRRLRQAVDSHATESFGGMRVVRAFGRSHTETQRFAVGGHLMARQELLSWRWSRAVELVWDVLIPGASAVLLVYGGYRVLEGELSIGDLMMFLVYLTMLLEPIAVLASTATQLQNNLAGLDRTLDLFAEPIEMTPPPDALQLRAETVRGRVTLRGVSFRYPRSEEHVLRGVSVDVQPGEIVALVGPSGAGKTTLCNLVARFYDPSSGSIELDGVDLRRIDVRSYRRLLGIVEQDVFLFDGSVADNISYAVRHAPREAIEHAARVANAHDFILQLPQGYDTVVGERGVRLSGGQRQRLAIARAVLADPRILILDEATSNLDTESERLIQQSMSQLMRGRTSFVIAHRLSTIVHADRILVLDGGRVIESGTHDELVRQSGRYRRMVELQMGAEAAMAALLPLADEQQPASAGRSGG